MHFLRACLIFPLELSFSIMLNIPSITEFAKKFKNKEDAIKLLIEMGVIKAVEDKVCIEVDCGERMGLCHRPWYWRDRHPS
jgi:hypothetical protein